MRGTARRSAVVAAGVVLNGVGTLAMLAIASRMFTVGDFATFSTWWIVVTLVTFPLGVFEALLTRQVVADVVAGAPIGSGTGAVAARGALLVLPMAVALGVGTHVVGDALFAGDSDMTLVVAAFLVSSFVQSLERGHAAGVDRFGVVAMLLTVDGALRASSLVLCAMFGLDSPLSAALAVLAGSLFTALIGHLRARAWIGLPDGRRTSFTASTAALLLAGSVGPMLINNASLPWLSGRGADAAVIGAFSGALTLSRIPIQLGGAAFGPLLRRFSHAIEVGDLSGERSEFRRALSWAAGLAVVFVLTFAAFAKPFISLYLGPAYQVPVWVCALLATSSGAMLVAIVAQVRAAARERWRSIAFSWIVAAGVFVAVLVVPGSDLLRCSLAPAAASLAGLGFLGIWGRSTVKTDQASALR